MASTEQQPYWGRLDGVAADVEALQEQADHHAEATHDRLDALLDGLSAKIEDLRNSLWALEDRVRRLENAR